MKHLYLISLLFLIACSQSKQVTEEEKTSLTQIKISTTMWDIILQLYNETPLHRDNFIKLAKDGTLDSLLFHRVIENFMIQGGDTNSKTAQPGDTLGKGDLPYTIPAEITPKLFHKKGVLAAARGIHPDRVSSSTQFYIVHGKVFNDSTLNHAEDRINRWLAEYHLKHDPDFSEDLDSLMIAIEQENWTKALRINSGFYELAKDYDNFERYIIPNEHREVYKTLGGTPHLDQNYTVFGEVISGINVVDSIAAVSTNDLDRPIEDVRILKVSLVL